MLVVNFAHPLTPDQLATVEALAGRGPASVLLVPAQLDPARSFAEQGRALVEAAGLTSEEWQTSPCS